MNIPSNELQRAARRAANRPFYLASVLAAYQRETGMSDEDIAGFLNCSPVDLPYLALCRRPVESSFQTDITHLASRFQLHGRRLAALIRDVEVAEEFHGVEGAVAMAARDREESGEPGDPT